MFAKKKTVVFFTAHTIRAAEVMLSKTPRIQNVTEWQLQWQNLPAIIQEVQKKYGDTWRVGVDDSYVYVTSLLLPASKRTDRSLVQQTLQEIIPDDLDQIVWDFKEIPTKTGSPDTQLIQFAGGVKGKFEVLLRALHDANVKVEMVEPVSFSLARLIEEVRDPVVVLYVDQTVSLQLVLQGCVIASETVQNLDLKTIQDFLAFAHSKSKISPTKLLLAGNVQNVNAAALSALNLEIQGLALAPMVGTALKVHLKGDDHTVMNLDLLSFQTRVTNVESTSSFRWKLWAPILFVLWLLLITGIGFGVKEFLLR